MGDGSRRSFRCLDCDKLRYVLQRELSRAARPHCLECGGCLEECDISRKREELPTKSQLAANARVAGIRKQRRCPHCGRAIGNNDDLARHLRLFLNCLTFHACERALFTPDGLLVIPGTIVIEKVRTGKWKVVGMDSLGTTEELYSTTTRLECSRYVDRYFGPVSLAR